MKHTLSILSFAVLLAASLGCGNSEMASGPADLNTASPEGAAQATSKADAAESKGNRGLASTAATVQMPKRAVIRNGSLAVRVADVEKAEDQVVALVQGLNGYVDSTDSSDLATATPRLQIRIRVPSDQFDKVLDKLEKLGTRLSKKINTEDVTASLADMAARLKIMRAQEDVYRNLLSKSHNTQEMMDVQDKLMALRGTIEGIEAQHRSTSQLATLSTIDLTLQQSSETAAAATNDPNWAKEAWGSATSVLGAAARTVGTAVIWMLVFSPIWLPFAWLVRSALRKGHATAKAPQFDVGLGNGPA